MKRIPCALALIVFAAAAAAAQDCVGDFELRTQEEVDAFTCARLTGNLVIANTRITNVDSLAELTYVQGEVRLEFDSLLTNVDGLGSLERVDGYVSIGNNPVLQHLDGLRAFRNAHALSIHRNASLKEVDGLLSYNGDLFITGNDSLANVDGLVVLNFPDQLTVRGNPMLGRCCRLYEQVTGIVDLIILDNAPGCNSVSEIVQVGPCSATAIESATPRPEPFVLYPAYPNPFESATTIHFGLSEPGPVRLAVYDALGREVVVLWNSLRRAGRHEVRFDAGGLPGGVYFYRMEAGASSYVGVLRLTR